MEIPSHLKKYEKRARKLIEQGAILDIEFSGETYQLLVGPSSKEEEEYWAFLQLDTLGTIKDAFCACEESELKGGCVHIAAAFLRIYNGRKRPLHVRFRHSLWNELCQICFEKVGKELDNFCRKGDSFVVEKGGNPLFSITARGSASVEKLDGLLVERKEETEETSLKFSNLSEEELSLWRQGKPPPQLIYELSLWNDIAKWLMLLQDERKPYNITFDYSEEKIPIALRVSFPELHLNFSFTRADLVRMIPYLSSVNSPLAIHTTQREAIQEIRYDKGKGELIVLLKEEFRFKEEEFEGGDKRYQFGGWSYRPGEGFYALDQHHILANRKIAGKRLSDVLTSHAAVVKKLLVGEALREEAMPLSYALHFDEEWNLHIDEYLFDVGDLSKGASRDFGDWVYLDGRGFFRVEGRLFGSVNSVIPEEEVNDFISNRRTWLNTIEGFETSLMTLESKVDYHLDEKGALHFEKSYDVESFGCRSKDFGPWIYLEGEGFFSKSSRTSLPVELERAVHRDDISTFLRSHGEELSLVTNFFSEKPLISGVTLEVELVDSYTLRIVPCYHLPEGIEEGSLRFFDDFAYCAGRGFYQLPLEMRLPEKYREELLLKEEKEIGEFLGIDLHTYKNLFGAVDYRLYRADEMVLEAEKIVAEEKKGKNVYGFQLYYSSPEGFVNVVDVWKAIGEKRRYFFSDAGLLKLEESRFFWVASLPKKKVDLKRKMVFLSTLDFIQIDAYDEISLRKSRRSDYEESKLYYDRLKGTEIAESPDLSELKSSLRPYQEKGVKWLFYLYLNNLSGLLCDDMGLGKTHQAMALIAAIRAMQRHYNGSERVRFLVVCPTSVIYHWEEKLQKFLPSLSIHTFHGNNRNLDEFDENCDLLLTSYGIFRNEVEAIKKIPFELAIFDEIQVAKNHTSKLHRTLLQLAPSMRIGLTGTPIENQVRELKALFDIVLPKYMPSERVYIEEFVKPIEYEECPETKKVLQRFINPLILRRKKEEVLTDLPEKVEEISHCDLLPEQLSLYNKTLQQSHRKILSELHDEKNPVPYIHIFALLSNLKQICNHPAVFYKDPKNYGDYQSGKWNLFVELLGEARESGQKVVVFSQYLAMLDIFESYLKKNHIGFATIRGSTQNRGEVIRRFNEEASCEVFVGSLHATGLGIDLTAASVVIHYDRWWNAAREEQATDRVHRIGQKRGVQVFKLVTKNTFEEKIDALILKKGKLMEEVVGSDDQQFVKKFSRSELADLLDYVEWR